jgi:hypothetical protein
MGRPLKIKISNTQDAGFNNPGPLIGMATTPTGELFYGVVGGNISTSDYDFPVTTTRIFPAGGSITTEGDGYILRQKGASKYLVSRVDSTAIDPEDAVVGQVIRIVTVGDTDWSAMMGDSNQGTIAIGLIFTVVAASAAGSTGTATECGICTLANKADASLASGEMTITYTAADSSAVRIKRMSNKQCIDFSDPPVVSLTNFFNILDDTVKIGGSGSAASPATRDLVQVENASL